MQELSDLNITESSHSICLPFQHLFCKEFKFLPDHEYSSPRENRNFKFMPILQIEARLQSSHLRHQYGIFGSKSQTSISRNTTRAGSEEGRLFSQASLTPVEELHRGYYTVSQRYQFYFRVVKTVLLFYEQAYSGKNIVAQENKIQIFKSPINFLLFVSIDKLTVCTNNCEKVGNDVINILTSEDAENMPCGSRM